MGILKDSEMCLCSPETIQSNPGNCMEMTLDDKGYYRDECRLCYKPIIVERWKEYYGTK